METYEKVLTKRKTWKMSQFKQAAIAVYKASLGICGWPEWG